MTDMLQNGLSWLEQQRTQFMAQTVIYMRGTDSIQISATPGKSSYQINDDTGMSVAAEVMDFIVLAGDLEIAGASIVPESGDTVTTDRGTYEVMYLAGDGFWRYSDPYGNAIRIHTKQIG
jgi:hypothetical protein